MALSLIKKTQLDPNIADLVGQYGSGYFLSKTVGGVSNSYATVGQLTGFSGYVQNNYATTGQLFGTGDFLWQQILELQSNTSTDYVLKAETGVLVSRSETGAFYPRSNPSGYATFSQLTGLSGYSASVYATINNLALTGSGLASSINSLSGTMTGSISALSGTLTGNYVLRSATGSFATTGYVNSGINMLSGNSVIGNGLILSLIHI